MVTEGCSESQMRSGRDEELRNGPEVKIDILDEGYWSPELFRGYRVTASVTERSFGGPDKCWGTLQKIKFFLRFHQDPSMNSSKQRVKGEMHIHTTL